MPEEPKDFPQSGADGSGQIGKQDWELPNSVSAPPDGFSPNVETASYGGYDESITDYHPPVEQGETLHPFKVTRFRDEYDTPKIRVRVGRFYYSAQISYYEKIDAHGPHNKMGNSIIEGDPPPHTITNTDFTTGDGFTNMKTNDDDDPTPGPASHWPLNVGGSGSGQLPPKSYFTFASSGGHDFYNANMEEAVDPSTLISDTIPDNFRFFDPDDMTIKKDFNDYIEFDAKEGVSTVWLRYIIDSSSNNFDIVNKDHLMIVYAEGTGKPTAHGPLGGISIQVVGESTQTSELVRANDPVFEAIGYPEGASDLNKYTAGCYYIRIAEIAAEGDEESRPVTQYVEDNIFAPHTFQAALNYTVAPGYGQASPTP